MFPPQPIPCEAPESVHVVATTDGFGAQSLPPEKHWSNTLFSLLAGLVLSHHSGLPSDVIRPGGLPWPYCPHHAITLLCFVLVTVLIPIRNDVLCP